VRRFLITLIAIAALGSLPGQADAVTMQTTRFVASFEGFLPCPYADPAGHATIGYGHLLHLGPPTRQDRRKWRCISKARGLRLLRQDLSRAEAQLMARIKGATVTPSMVTALTSFVFNLGPGGIGFLPAKGKGSDTNIAWQIRNGRYYVAGRQLLLFDGIIVNGKRYELEGLQIRRRKEFNLLVKDVKALRQCGDNTRCVKKLVAGQGSGDSGGLTRRRSGGISPG
jgi:GH24 family phage-related lysozyme (muramidase)